MSLQGSLGIERMCRRTLSVSAKDSFATSEMNDSACCLVRLGVHKKRKDILLLLVISGLNFACNHRVAVLGRSDLSLSRAGGYTLVSYLKSKGKFRMKRIAVLTLLVALGVAWSIPAKAQRMSVEENARQSRKADKKQQKMNRKAAKKQQKAMKKYEKAQRRAQRKTDKKANHRAKRT